MQSHPDASPINPLPAVVVALTLMILGVEIVLWAAGRGLIGGAGGVGWRIDAMQSYGFSGRLFDWMVETGRFEFANTIRFVTYPFIHAGFLHLAMVLVFLLALGKMVSEVLGSMALIVTFFACAIVGALVFALLTQTEEILIGGYPSAYGLIGTYTFILWVRLGQTGQNQMQAFGLIGILMGIQLIFGVLFNVGLTWIAEVAGFVTGFLIAPLVAPGGLRRVLDKLRQR
ncbi:MAG: rhomboid family intramembrane serine protease [Pseudomonadota bacterium]